MAGRRHKSFRRGDVNEELGILLLKAFATVAPVPRPEDVGIDAIATLLRPGPNQMLIAEDSFYVQIKSASTRTIAYKGHEIEWLTQLKLPLFIGSVNASTCTMELFTCHTLSQALIEKPWKEVQLLLDAGVPQISEDVRFIHICPPALRWSASDLASETFKKANYPILKKHVRVEQKNCQLRTLRHLQRIKWQTNEAPEDNGFLAIGQMVEGNLVKIFREHNALFTAFVMDCAVHKDAKVLEALLLLRDHMRNRGFDPDPQGLCDAICGMLQGGALDLNPPNGVRQGVSSRVWRKLSENKPSI
jgi:hypothetical protein